MTKWIAALIVAAALSGILNLPKTLRAHARGVDWVRAEKASWQTSARRARRMTWTCERRAGLRRSGWPTVPWRLNTQARHRAVLHYWRSRHAACRTQLVGGSVGNVAAWLCIHRGEAAWNDSGDPYWGGLQFDRGFMYTYGRDMIRRYHGFANVWPPRAQMIVAERARRSGRGFSPWPTTARACGLL